MRGGWAGEEEGGFCRWVWRLERISGREGRRGGADGLVKRTRTERRRRSGRRRVVLVDILAVAAIVNTLAAAAGWGCWVEGFNCALDGGFYTPSATPRVPRGAPYEYRSRACVAFQNDRR